MRQDIVDDRTLILKSKVGAGGWVAAIFSSLFCGYLLTCWILMIYSGMAELHWSDEEVVQKAFPVVPFVTPFLVMLFFRLNRRGWNWFLYEDRLINGSGDVLAFSDIESIHRGIPPKPVGALMRLFSWKANVRNAIEMQQAIRSEVLLLRLSKGRYFLFFMPRDLTRQTELEQRFLKINQEKLQPSAYSEIEKERLLKAKYNRILSWQEA
ncbi:MAG: hypothetical protein RL095_3274 [Verrucomicrobiota bacterium]|jgi:hypothetical protein